MKLQHTPGPWIFYADLPSTDPEWHIVTTANKLRVLANVHIERGNAMDQANARLIAAAPDMLEALLKTRAYLLTVDCVFMDPEGSAGQMLVAEIDDVIERATGLTIEEVLEYE